MRKEIADLVYPVFTYALRVKTQLARGESLSLQKEHVELQMQHLNTQLAQLMNPQEEASQKSLTLNKVIAGVSEGVDPVAKVLHAIPEFQTGAAGGFSSPIAIDLDEFHAPLVMAAKRREIAPIDGVLVRDWDPDGRATNPGIQLGLRVYEIEGIKFVRVRFTHDDRNNGYGCDFVAVDRKDYRRLYKIALKCRMEEEPPCVAPVLPSDQLDLLWQNTIGYL